MPQEERELFCEIIAGSQNAFEQIYKIYHKGLYHNLRKLIGNDEIAKEILQDVFLKIWEKRVEINPDKSFGAYLFRIGQNMAMDFYRREKRSKMLLKSLTLLITEVIEQPLENEISVDEEEILRLAIAKLPPQRRRIFVLCKLDGKSYQEVSQLLGISVSTISDHLVKAFKAVKNQLLNGDLKKR